MNPVIQRRREQEESRARLQAQVAQNFTLEQRSAWESRASDYIQRSHVTRAVQGLTQLEQTALQHRRARLAAKLAQEEEVYKHELAQLQETSEQHRQKLIDRALAFKKQREEERQKFAEEQYYKQWRLGCDDLRSIDSQKRLEQVCIEREQQIVQQKQLEKQRELDERKWFEQNEMDRLAQEMKAQEEALKFKQKQISAKKVLEEQIAELEAQRETERKDREQLKLQFQQQMVLDAEMNKKRAEEKAAENRKKMLNIVAFNEEQQRRKKEEDERQRQEDIALLRTTLQAHYEETAQQVNDKARMRQDMLAYRAHIAKRKASEAAMEKELERLTNIELSKVHQIDDLRRQTEELARQKLMKEVYEIRYQQCLDREQQRQQQLAMKRQELQEMEDKMRQWKDEEQKEQANQLQQAKQRSEMFKSQAIASVQRKKEERELEQQYSRSQNSAADAQYRKWLEQEILAPPTAAQFARKPVHWD